MTLEWAGQTVRVHLWAEEILLIRDGEEPLRYGRLAAGKHEVARWNGPPRRLPSSGPASDGSPRWDPAYLDVGGEVEARSLGCYEALAEEVGQ